MTTDDVLAEVPKDNGYSPTCNLRWFVGRAGVLDDVTRILAQQCTSCFQGVPDVWVAVQEEWVESGGG